MRVSLGSCDFGILRYADYGLCYRCLLGAYRLCESFHCRARFLLSKERGRSERTTTMRKVRLPQTMKSNTAILKSLGPLHTAVSVSNYLLSSAFQLCCCSFRCSRFWWTFAGEYWLLVLSSCLLIRAVSFPASFSLQPHFFIAVSYKIVPEGWELGELFANFNSIVAFRKIDSAQY